ncbi:MFS transporter [Candidatus Bipolaricaulota bacterium]|nr:MFS transporter [Candidatus Bipolaricaulota bacterium]
MQSQITIDIIFRPLHLSDFRLLWLGQSVSLLGDQFYFVALTWLTLQITGSGLALGTVLMLAAIPRAALMLLGGALSDRISSRLIMFISNAVRAVLVAALTALVIMHSVQLWHLWVMALLFGTFDAFFYPAFQSFIPRLVPDTTLEQANSLVQGTSHLSVLVDPALAGVLVATTGTATAFAIDAVTFVFAAITVSMMHSMSKIVVSTEPTADAPGDTQDTDPKKRGLIADAVEGLRYAWNDTIFRALLFIVAAINFSFAGPMNVGLAATAKMRFAEGATAFGVMMSAWGGGALVGTIIGGLIARPRRRGLITIAVTFLLGLGLASLGWVPGLSVAVVVIAFMSTADGLIDVLLLAWLQLRTEKRFLGRLMSLVMFASQGLAPVSYIVAGVLVDHHLTLMFNAAGGLVLLATAYAALNRSMRQID